MAKGLGLRVYGLGSEAVAALSRPIQVGTQSQPIHRSAAQQPPLKPKPPLILLSSMGSLWAFVVRSPTPVFKKPLLTVFL